MSYIKFENINKYYNNQHVLKDLDLTIDKGSFVTLLGPSGCGKSTLLRCLAGLESISTGKIFLDDEDITLKNPRQRNIGMIFQQYSLFPTMTVYQNISFGLRMKKLINDDRIGSEPMHKGFMPIHENKCMGIKMKKERRETIDKLVKEALALVQLEGSEKKFPSQLSGGEQQRVALARCIVTKPKVLLLDEPFSAIDAKLRKSLQTRIKEIHRELNMTCVFVTHDQEEAMIMSDVIHLMHNGIIEQSGNPAQVYSNPKNPYVASFIGNYNIIDKKDLSRVFGYEVSSEKIAIRPEMIAIEKEEVVDVSEFICAKGVIVDNILQGNIIRYFVDINGLKVKVDLLFNNSELFENNQEIYLKINKNNIILF